MTEMYPIAPLALGDKVVLTEGSHSIQGVVRGVSNWRYTLVEAKDGALYLEVCFDRSFVSWSRIVLLEAWIRPEDHERHLALAEKIAYSPDRTNVDDVDGAAQFCSPRMKLQRIGSQF